LLYLEGYHPLAGLQAVDDAMSEGEDGLVVAADDVEAGIHQTLDNAAFDDCPSVHLLNYFKTFIKIQSIIYYLVCCYSTLDALFKVYKFYIPVTIQCT
jgi:hypothetical protein